MDLNSGGVGDTGRREASLPFVLQSSDGDEMMNLFSLNKEQSVGLWEE